MSRRIGNVVIIEPEPDLICFNCGKAAETRPYGRNGEEICYECGMRDPVETEVQMGMRLFGYSREDAERHVRVKWTRLSALPSPKINPSGGLTNGYESGIVV